MPRCLCGEIGSLDALLAHCTGVWDDPHHGIDTRMWQCGGCGLGFTAGEDPAVWGEALPDGRIRLPICHKCERDLVPAVSG